MLASSLLVNAYVQGRRVGWDFTDETPEVDARGAQSAPFAATIETHLANAVLTNGSRFYVDHAHPEYSSPECRTPMEALIADRAGEEILRKAMHAANQSLPIGQEIVVYKNNSDGKSNSYGCHENYLVSRTVPFQELTVALLPWFVSRQVFCGAGKVGAEHGAPAVEFQLSQRADFFEESVGLETTLKRPLINTRDEPHADAAQYRRLHVIAGDANCSELATFLKLATTSMVLAALEDGAMTHGLILKDPVHAVRQISHDPSLQQTVECTNGTRLTGLELQWEFFDRCRKHAEDRGFEAVAAEEETAFALSEWERVLSILEEDPSKLAGELDWPAKQSVLAQYRERDGMQLGDPKAALIDLQYHDLRSTRGLYARLVQGGHMRTLVDIATVTRAILTPPESTRAYFRGRCLAQWPDAVISANWDSIVLETGTASLQRIPMLDPLKGTRQHVEALFEQCSTPADLVARLTT